MDHGSDGAEQSSLERAMSDTTPINEGHIAEGELVRYLDEEMTTGERGAVARHLIGCATCAASLELLRSERARFASLLGEMGVPAVDPARRAASLAAIERAATTERARVRPVGDRKVALRAAVVGGILFASAAGAATSSTVRDAVSDAWHAVAGSSEEVVVDESRDAARRFPLTGATIGFIPTSESFVVEIANAQQAGLLVLGISVGESVTATAVDGREAVDLVVLPDGMRIENQSTATGDYAVSLPRHLREVHIRVGDAPDQVFTVSELSSAWVSTIDLSTGRDVAGQP